MKLTQAQIEEFNQNGFVIVPNLFDPTDFDPIRNAITAFIDRRADELMREGKIKHLYENEPFEKRIGSIYQECHEIVYGTDIMKMRARPLFDFLFNEKLLDAVECLIGSEITCSPIQHLRAKMPSNYGKGTHELVPWHQDSGVTLEEAENSEIVTCWIPLVEATRKTGCMELIPGVKKYLDHINQPPLGTTIHPSLLPKTEPVCGECPVGGVVFMNKLTPHRGIPNTSDIVRWTIDLRYQKTGTPTGRPFHPEFPVRSQDPAMKRIEYSDWCKRWMQALEESKGKNMHRHVKPEQVLTM